METVATTTGRGDRARTRVDMTALKGQHTDDDLTQKFKGPQNPLVKENAEKVMSPANPVRAALKEQMYSVLLAQAASIPDPVLKQAELTAIQTARRQDLEKEITSSVNSDFVNDFRQWLVKRGRVEDHIAAGWANDKFINSPGHVSHHPSVEAYVEKFIDARINFMTDIAQMKKQVSTGEFTSWDINTLWTYYKYVVRNLSPDNDEADAIVDRAPAPPPPDQSEEIAIQSRQQVQDLHAEAFVAKVDELNTAITDSISAAEQREQDRTDRETVNNDRLVAYAERQTQLLEKLVEKMSTPQASPTVQPTDTTTPPVSQLSSTIVSPPPAADPYPDDPVDDAPAKPDNFHIIQRVSLSAPRLPSDNDDSKNSQRLTSGPQSKPAEEETVEISDKLRLPLSRVTPKKSSIATATRRSTRLPPKKK